MYVSAALRVAGGRTKLLQRQGADKQTVNLDMFLEFMTDIKSQRHIMFKMSSLVRAIESLKSRSTGRHLCINLRNDQFLPRTPAGS